MELRKHTMFTSHWIWELHTKEFFFKRAGVTETGPRVSLSSPAAGSLAPLVHLTNMLPALWRHKAEVYFKAFALLPRKPSLALKGWWLYVSQPFWECWSERMLVFLVLNEVPSGSLHLTFLCLNCSEHLHMWMLPLDFPGLSLRPFLQRGPNPQFHFYPQGLSYCLYSTYHYVKLCIHWFVYLFTVYPFPHRERRNSAFVVHQYLFSAFSKS